MNDSIYTTPPPVSDSNPIVRLLHIVTLFAMAYALTFSPSLDEPWYNIAVFLFWIFGCLTVVAALSNIEKITESCKTLDNAFKGTPTAQSDRRRAVQKALNHATGVSHLPFTGLLALAGYYVVVLAAASRSHYGKATICLVAALLWTAFLVYTREALTRFHTALTAEDKAKTEDAQ